MRILDLLSEEKAAVPPKPRNFVSKNAKMGGAGQHKDKKKAEKQGDVKHKKDLATMESQGVAEGWKEKVGAGLTAAAMATGAGGVVLNPARPIGPKGQTVANPYKATNTKSAEDDAWAKIEKRKAADKKGVAEGSDDKFSVADKVEQLVDQYRLYDKRGWTDLFAKLAGRKLEVAEIRREMEYASKFLQLLDSIRMRSDYRGQQDPRKDQELIDLSNQWLDLFNKATTEFKGISGQGVAEAVEDRTSYQVAKVLHDHGIKYDSTREDELIKVIGLALVKELNMSPKQARGVMNSEDFLGDTFGELQHMSQGVEEAGMYRRPGSPTAGKRDEYSAQAGMGKRDSLAYQLDGGANDEGEDDAPSSRYQAPQDKPKMLGLFFYNVPPGKEQEAASFGIKQTKSGKWAKTKYSTSGRTFDFQKDLADKAFGQGRWWAPKTEGVVEGLDYNKRQQLIQFLAKKLDWDASHLELASDAELISWYKNVQAGKKPMGY